ncbi:hypothetical protein QA584_17380 [Anaerocolumna sp. AGMB13025]|uniref:hypothetical protein n=1 Tax=Anaerocolumna sp. AGMB13025 TaxID=3039116 RepID=UPI00241C0ACD|nr:hypothetical protein [Anaerocolumna sp. AGMB13025]WFR55373.1 hypothetical protein QA584_17380 [Anaerocolumna sp. AGMB13025]
MNQQTADELIEKAVKSAIKEYSKEQKMEKKRKALHNTKLLLKNYRKIQKSIEEGVSEVMQLEKEYIVLNESDELYIESIKRSKLRSLIVVTHIDKALALAQEECKRKGIPEKYDAFISCMLDGMTYDDAAQKYLSSKPSISRWINDITKEVSIQLFGVEGMDLI